MSHETPAAPTFSGAHPRHDAHAEHDPAAEPVTLADVEALGRARLSPMARDYYAGGAGDEVTVRDNVAAFGRWALRPRALVDVSTRSTITTVLGRPVAAPVLVAPTAFHQLAHDEGELATARGAAAAGTVMTVSTLSTRAIEDVVASARAVDPHATVWFQLYVYRDRAATAALVRRAEAAGCAALVVTVDSPLLGRREKDVRNRFHLPPGLVARNVLADGYGAIDAPPGAAESGLAAYFTTLLDPSISWRDIAWLRSITTLPILVKGILRGDDAARAIDHGAHGVIVSNHGGRQLDGAIASIDALPEVAAVVSGRGEVLLDGGVRRGTDVLKALALGARAVLIGRPTLWGLAWNGADGVRRVLDLLRAEVDHALALSGCPTPADVGSDLVVRR